MKSASMLADLGLDYVILRHSERRYYHKEDNQLISKKVDIALSQGLKIIFCVTLPLNVMPDAILIVVFNFKNLYLLNLYNTLL